MPTISKLSENKKFPFKQLCMECANLIKSVIEHNNSLCVFPLFPRPASFQARAAILSVQNMYKEINPIEPSTTDV